MTTPSANQPDPRDAASPAFDPQDPRFTALALGEGAGDELRAFEVRLATDPAARAEADALRALAGALESGLATAPTGDTASALAPDQRDALL
ncbi:MAG: hypothetical protein O2894_10125, partial [Planctomycetota bacterium]|nr:hypothetical protein [Planctomycetota bacterium]